MSEEALFDPKQINLPYTIAIIKPNLVLEVETFNSVIEQIENSDCLKIKNMVQR